MPHKIIKTLSSSSHKKGIIYFYKDLISFQIEADHPFRTIFYSEIESFCIQNKRKRFLPILLIVRMLFLIVLICFYLFQNGIILNVVFGVLLLILVLANQKKTNNYFIQVIKEGLFMDVFYSNRRHEVLIVFS